MIIELESGITLISTSSGKALLLDDSLRKSYSSDLAKHYPGGKWITVTDESSPLHGRHLFILPHHDKTASVLIGGGNSMRHKLLTVKKKEEPTGGGEGGEGEEKKPEDEEEKKPEAKPEEKPKPELTEEENKAATESIKTLTKEINDKKSGMYQYIQEQWGIQRDLTPEEEKKIETKTAHLDDPVQKAVQGQIERQKLIRDKEKEAIHQIVKDAKAALIEENPSAQGDKGIAAVVKENAEELLQMHMAIQALAKERKDIRKMVRVGKLNDKFREGHEIVASYQPLTGDDIKQSIMDEKALDAELKAHYQLMRLTRGVEGQDTAKGDATTVRAIKQGGFETVTGFIGQLTGKAVITKKTYDELGSDNAAILARHYLKGAGHNMSKVTKDLEGYLTGESNPVAFHANQRGEYFIGLAEKVRQFGAGSDNIMTSRQALGTGLKYMNKAYECYGQAEGALNQGAEMLYGLKGKANSALEFHSNYTDSLERKRQALGLKPKDVSIKHSKEGGFTMTVPPRSFDKLIHEQETEQHGEGLGLEHSASDIKDFKANTDDFHPTGINDYTPPDKNGVREKITFGPEKQAAVRLLEKQKKIAIDAEAGTGKSLMILLSKAHLDDAHGKQHRMLVSMPQKLMANFADEVKKFTNYNVAIIDNQTPNQKAKLYASDPNTIVLANDEKFNFDLPHIRKNPFDIVVADEAHKITQREGRKKSVKSEGLREIAQSSPYYIADSGTLMQNNLSELYFHANIMDPKKFSSQKDFMSKFGNIHKGVGYQKQLQDFMLHHLGDNIMSIRKENRAYKMNLHTHEVKLHPEQAKAYKQISQDFLDKKIATFQRDRQLSNTLNDFEPDKNNKYKKIKDIIDGHLKNKEKDEKVILYAENYSTVKNIHDFLTKHYPGQEAVFFTGKDPLTGKANKIANMRENKDRFKNDPKVKFAIHTRAGVEGLNLQYDGKGGGATTAIAVASGEKNYSTLDQFFSRADRTGALKDIDAHIILTDTPHDIGTQVRLDEKKAVGKVLDANVRKSPAAMAKALGLYLLRRRQ